MRRWSGERIMRRTGAEKVKPNPVATQLLHFAGSAEKRDVPGQLRSGLGRCRLLMGSAYGSRTRDLRLERAASWTTRRMRQVLRAREPIIPLTALLVNRKCLPSTHNSFSGPMARQAGRGSKRGHPARRQGCNPCTPSYEWMAENVVESVEQPWRRQPVALPAPGEASGVSRRNALRPGVGT